MGLFGFLITRHAFRQHPAPFPTDNKKVPVCGTVSSRMFSESPAGPFRYKVPDRGILCTEGYKKSEITRVLAESVTRGILYISNAKIEVSESSIEVARRYLLLDFIAHYGKSISQANLKGTIIVPGFGQNFGVSLSKVADSILPKSGIFGSFWAKDGLILKDIEFLIHQGWIIQQ